MRFSLPQSNVRRLLPASDYCLAPSNEIAVHSSDSEAVLGSSRKLGGAAKHLTAAKNAFVCRPLNFRVRMLLKSAVRIKKWSIVPAQHLTLSKIE